MKRLVSLVALLMVLVGIQAMPVSAYYYAGSDILGKFVDTADSVLNAHIKLVAGYGDAYLAFDVAISGDYGVAVGAASGYSIKIADGMTIVSPMYLLKARSKDYDGLEKNVKYYKTLYWKQKYDQKTSYGYRVVAIAYIKVDRKIEHALWFDSKETVIYSPNTDVGGNVYINA